MKHGAYLFALRAAAKVAFATTVAGCSDVVIVEPDDETDETDETNEVVTSTSSSASSGSSVASSSASTGTGTPVVPVCDEPAAGWEIYDEPTFECCIGAIAADIADGPLPFDAAEPVKGCCAQLVMDNYEAIWSGEPLVHPAPEEVIAACCELRHGNTGCTPWGPPMPPAFDDDEAPVSGERWVLDLREEARAHSPSVPRHPALTQAAIETWRGRMVNESASSAVFAALARQLEAAGAPTDAVQRCDTFAEEERSHGVLCASVVAALGGEAIAALPPAEPFPRHEGVDPMEAAIRNVLSVACLSETVAVALIGAERAEMPDGELRDLLTRIWADEIGHARFGWRFVAEQLPSLDDAARQRLSLYLRVAFRHLERHELAHLPASSRPPAEGVELGLCEGNAARNLFYATVREVVVRRLDDLGLQASLAWESRRAARAPAALRASA
jgi:hypothetical protein